MSDRLLKESDVLKLSYALPIILNSEFYKMVKSLPSAEPERKKGKWMVDEGQQVLMQDRIADGEDWKVCSVCGCGFMVGHEYNTDTAYHKTIHNFCPQCGAYMRGESDEKTIDGSPL